jgi:hypothetical protein
MASSLPDLLGRMIIQTEINIADLRMHAEQSAQRANLGQTLNELIQAELLRLDMLRTVRRETVAREPTDLTLTT